MSTTVSAMIGRSLAGLVLVIGIWHLTAHYALDLVSYRYTFGDFVDRAFAQTPVRGFGVLLASAGEIIAVVCGVLGLLTRWSGVLVAGTTACAWFLVWNLRQAPEGLERLIADAQPAAVIGVDWAALACLAALGLVWAISELRRRPASALAGVVLPLGSAVIAWALA